MSVVSNFILICPAGGNAECVEALNSSSDLCFQQVDRYAGGFKAVEWDVYMAATNYFSATEAAEVIQSMTWEEPVQLLAADEGDSRWREILLSNPRIRGQGGVR